MSFLNNISPWTLLYAFIAFEVLQLILDTLLEILNFRFYSNPENQKIACKELGIDNEDLKKSLAYSQDKLRYALTSSWIRTLIFLVFLAWGGFGYIEQLSFLLVSQDYPIVVGLVFFALLGLLSYLMGLPFQYYYTFVLEQKHGFNRQTPRRFVMDQLKGIFVAVLLGTPLLALILYIMQTTGEHWWLLAWAAASGFSILTVWIYPTLLAPLFNKFKPLEDGELKEKINALAKKINFKTQGIFVMDASVRSSHGNAYFTGLFSAKRIVLFDTLLEILNPSEVVAVLAHELGHFKLHHVRWMLIRSVVETGIFFYIIQILLPNASWYQAFYLSGVSFYGALLVFPMWFGLIQFFLRPVSSYLSRRNEFAADRFAFEVLGESQTLAQALLKLREKSHVLPVVHPLYSLVHYSHPPILERIRALRELEAHANAAPKS